MTGGGDTSDELGQSSQCAMVSATPPHTHTHPSTGRRACDRVKARCLRRVCGRSRSVCVGEQHSYPSKSQVGHPPSGETNVPCAPSFPLVSPRGSARHATIHARPSTCDLSCRQYKVTAPRPGKAWHSSGIGSDKLRIQRRSLKTPGRRSRAPGVGPARRGRATLTSPGCCRKSVRDDARALACWYRGEASHHIVKG